MISFLGAAVTLVACQQPESAATLPSPATRPAPASNAIHVSIDVAPPVWIEGDPLRVRLTVENPGPSALTVPAAWLRGEGIYLRQVPPGRQAAQAPPAGLTAILASSFGPSQEAAAGPESVKLLSGSSLSVPITFPAIAPPDGEAFDVFFLSSAPVAGTLAIRVERCENLRGALARLETDRGRITFALSPESAPLAVRNFVKLAESGFYDGIAFHRIVRGLCIQAGDPETRTGDLTTLQGTVGKTYNGLPIPLERTRAAFDKGTVGLARTPDLLYLNVRSALAQFYQVDTGEALDAKLRTEWPAALQLQESAKALTSGTSQFFICTSSAPHFVGRYAAFAKVVEGMDVVTAIEGSEVLGAKTDNPNLADRPVLPTRIVKIGIDRMPSPNVKPK